MSQPFGECDCCGKLGRLTHCWVCGIETFACDGCTGADNDDDSDRYEYEMGEGK